VLCLMLWVGGGWVRVWVFGDGDQVEDAKAVITKFRMTGANRVSECSKRYISFIGLTRE